MSTVFINERGNIYKMIAFIELFTINEMIVYKVLVIIVLRGFYSRIYKYLIMK